MYSAWAKACRDIGKYIVKISFNFVILKMIKETIQPSTIIIFSSLEMLYLAKLWFEKSQGWILIFIIQRNMQASGAPYRPSTATGLYSLFCFWLALPNYCFDILMSKTRRFYPVFYKYIKLLLYFQR